MYSEYSVILWPKSHNDTLSIFMDASQQRLLGSISQGTLPEGKPESNHLPEKTTMLEKLDCFSYANNKSE